MKNTPYSLIHPTPIPPQTQLENTSISRVAFRRFRGGRPVWFNFLATHQTQAKPTTIPYVAQIALNVFSVNDHRTTSKLSDFAKPSAHSISLKTTCRTGAAANEDIDPKRHFIFISGAEVASLGVSRRGGGVVVTFPVTSPKLTQTHRLPAKTTRFDVVPSSNLPRNTHTEPAQLPRVHHPRMLGGRCKPRKPSHTSSEHAQRSPSTTTHTALV